MGNSQRSSTMASPTPSTPKRSDPNHKFLHDFTLDSCNGLYINNNYLPEEVIFQIISHLDAKDILNASLVCKRWFNMTRSPALWMEKYERCYSRRHSKHLDWYVYYALFTGRIFDKNLLKNGNGQEKFNHWKIIKNYGDSFEVEKTPQGADPLPLDVEDFNGHTSCFATSYYECDKQQDIFLSPLTCRILTEYKPDIYASEWTAGRFDCGSIYNVVVSLYGKEYRELLDRQQRLHDLREETDDGNLQYPPVEPLLLQIKKTQVRQWEGRAWSKIEMVFKDYPDGVEAITFKHIGQDTQFWKGHYGSKMAGGVVKIVFDSIKERPDRHFVNSPTAPEEPETLDEQSQISDTNSQGQNTNPPTPEITRSPHLPNASPR